MDKIKELLEKSRKNTSGELDSDDDGISLRPDTLLALQQFIKDKEIQEEREKKETQLLDTATLVTSEDWQLSQFWYDETTALALANELIAAAEDIRKERQVSLATSSSSSTTTTTTTAGTTTAAATAMKNSEDKDIVTIGCVSCPSVYKALLSVGIPSGLRVYILEYDKRFSIFGDAFIYYDFNKPLTIPSVLHHACDILILDPPFLNPDCLSNFSQTVALMKKTYTSLPTVLPRILLCTGAVMLPHAKRLLQLRPTRKSINHSNRLSNPFALYTNYMVPERLEGWDTEAETAVTKEEKE